ncbi:MAG: GNAT family protein [Cellulophaga sp.]
MKTNTINLESERLILKRLSLDHLSEKYRDWMNDPKVFQFLESGGDYTLEKLKSFLEEVEKNNILFWAIHVKRNGKHIGNIKIDPISKSINSGEYGILMGDRAQWGKGYAEEASRLVILYCIEKLKLKQITLGVVDSNVPAINLYKKLGFEVIEYKENNKLYLNNRCRTVRMKLLGKNVN